MCSTFCQCLTLYFSALIMEFVTIQKQAYAGIIEKKEGVAEKREKMALFTENYQEEMMQILKDMAHVRISGTKEEADCAVYLQECCKKMGFEARLEAFQVEMCDIHEAVLTVDGKEIPCKGYRCAGSGTVEAPFYYMPNTDACSLAQCKGKIVMLLALLHMMEMQTMQMKILIFVSSEALYVKEVTTKKFLVSISMQSLQSSL